MMSQNRYSNVGYSVDASSIHNVPECPDPERLQIVETTDNSISIEWDDVENKEVKHLIRYKSLGDYAWKSEYSAKPNKHTIFGLKKDETYELQIQRICGGNGLIEDLKSSWIDIGAVMLGAGNDLICNVDINIISQDIGVDYIDLAWSGQNATTDGVRYQLRYKSKGTGWNEITVLKGNSYRILDLEKQTKYTVEVRAVWGGQFTDFDQQCSWQELGIIRTLKKEEEEEKGGDEDTVNTTFACGDDPEPYEATATAPLLSPLTPGEIIVIAGFPIVLETVSSGGGEGIFSGTGVVPIPFGGKHLEVEFSNVFVNIEYQITQGDVLGISDNPANYPAYSTNPIILGQEICQYPPEQPGFDENGIWQPSGNPYNPQGFGPSGQFVKQPPYPGYTEGAPFTPDYDPNGFDSEGIHVITGTLYNEAGCSQVGIDSLGNPCNPVGQGPYYWLSDSTSVATEEGLAFASSNSSRLMQLITASLSTLDTRYQDSIAVKSNACNGIRAEMEVSLANLGYERQFIFGPNDKYFEEGMHYEFFEEPKALDLEFERDPDEVKLEADHISLYGCDKLLYVFHRVDSVLNVLQGADDLDKLHSDLIALAQTFSAAQVQTYSNEDSLSTWVMQQMEQALISGYFQDYGEYIGDSDTPVNDILELYEGPEASSSTWLVSNMSGNTFDPKQEMAFIQSLEMTAEDIAFEFLQGREYINNIHRSFYLRHMSQQRMLQMKSSAGGGGNDDPSLMPVILSKEVMGLTYSIYLDQIRFRPNGCMLNAYLIINDPNSGQDFAFQAENIQFGTTGLAQPEASRLSLVSDISFRVTNAARMTIKGGVTNSDTYISWDCEGFAGIGIDAEVEICRKYLIPINPNNLEPVADESVLVKGYFKTEAPAWGEFLADIEFDPFALDKAPDVKFFIESAKIDMSNSDSPDIDFPSNYTSAFVQNGQVSPLWRGFHMDNLTVVLPTDKFSIDETPTDNVSPTPVSVSAQNVIFDNMGLSGAFSVNNILPIDEGVFGKWAMSIDTFGVNIISNHLVDVGFSGKVHVPIVKPEAQDGIPTPEECLGYSAKIMDFGHYEFDVSPNGDGYQVDMLKGEMILQPNSYVSMDYIDGEFLAEAKLHGVVSIVGQVGQNSDKEINLPDLSFQNLTLRNTQPYFSAGQWGFPTNGNSLNLFGFGIQMDKLKMVETANDNEAALDVLMFLQLSKTSSDEEGNASSSGVTAGGGFRVIGELVENNGRQKWQYKNFKVSTIYVDASFPSTKIAGLLRFYEDDPVYGDGFSGMLNAEFAGLGEEAGVGLKIQALGQFGKKENAQGEIYKYFFVDALVNINPGIEMGGLQLKGFGGGVYHHMNRPASSSAILPSNPGGPASQYSAPETSNANANSYQQMNINLPEIGEALSGITYTPDDTKGLGLKATVLIAASKEEAFNGNATFEILFNSQESGGGLSDIWFYGTGRFMDKIDFNIPTIELPQIVGVATPPPPPTNGSNANSAVVAYIDIHNDFNNNVLTGNFELYMNMVGTIVGIQENNRAGYVDLYVDKDQWFINAGRPDNRNGAKLVIPGLGDVAEMNFYMDIGNGIPTMPELPPAVQSLTGLGYFMANESARATGNGFAFGASLNISAPDLNYLIFYASLDAGMGFDMMLQDYGDAICQESGDTLGINGWYASGQAWAYIQGTVGIKTTLFGAEENYDVLDIAAAAALQAKLPNPFWAKGSVGGHYSILNGLVNGECNFEFELGEECQIIGADDPAEDLMVILDVVPGNGGVNISPLSSPLVTFNLPVDESLELTDLSGNPVDYYIDLKHVNLKDQNGNILAVEKKWSENKKSVSLLPKYALPANETVTIAVSVEVEKDNQVISTEVKEATFTVGDLIDYIPESNIAVSYPMPGQFNFYLKEHTGEKGFVQLKADQGYLITNPPAGYTPKVVIEKPDGIYYSGDVTYDQENKRIMFDMPSTVLEQNTIYKLRLTYWSTTGTPQMAGAAIPLAAVAPTDLANVLGISSSGSGPNASETELNAYGEAEEDEMELLSVYFRTSEYDNLHDKLEAFEQNCTSNGSDYTVAFNTANLEPFDRYERQGTNFTPPLLTLKADLSNTWYKNQVKPLIYDHFPVLYPYFFEVTNRPTFGFGSPPIENVAFMNVKAGMLITEENYIQQENFVVAAVPAGGYPNGGINYSVGDYYLADYEDFKMQALNFLDENSVGIDPGYDVYSMYPILQNICESDELPEIPNGDYRVDVIYTIPGTEYTKSYSILLQY